jgi:hypothetical protein
MTLQDGSRNPEKEKMKQPLSRQGKKEQRNRRLEQERNKSN